MIKDAIYLYGGDFLKYVFNFKEWTIFAKRLLAVVLFSIVCFILWLFPLSLIVAPFYSITTGDLKKVEIYEDLEGKTTVSAVRNGVQGLLDKGLVTNFLGVNWWIDNKYNEQVGEIEMYRLAMYTLENNLGRNRGTGGANDYLTQARADIYADFELPIFTSYTTRLKNSIKNMDKYLAQLEEQKAMSSEKRKAVFIVNSDNLAEVLDKIKQQIQNNLVGETTFTTEDDKFYRIRGNLIATYYYLKGIDPDFKNKMIDKTSYKDNFLPIMAALEKSISNNPIVILEFFGHVSKIEKEANVITQKLGELRDKLRKG